MQTQGCISFFIQFSNALKIVFWDLDLKLCSAVIYANMFNFLPAFLRISSFVKEPLFCSI